MSPWVEKGQRAGFERAVDAMAAEHATTRDHGEISRDSRGVSPGMEVQRDRLPRANEVIAAKAYRLPGADHTLEQLVRVGIRLRLGVDAQDGFCARAAQHQP